MYSLARFSNVGASRSALRSPTGSAPCTTAARASFAFDRASVSGTSGYVPSVSQRDRPRTLYFTTQEREPPAASRRPKRGSPPSHTTRWPLSGSARERMIESLSFLGMFGSSGRQLPHSYPVGPNKHGSYRTSANEKSAITRRMRRQSRAVPTLLRRLKITVSAVQLRPWPLDRSQASARRARGSEVVPDAVEAKFVRVFRAAAQPPGTPVSPP